MSSPTASCLPSTKAKEAVRYVIGTVLAFNPVDDCPLWLALIYDVTDESQVNLYNQWLWLTPDDILALQYRPDPSKQKIVPLSRGYHTHVTRFKAMYSELQCTPGWTDLDIFKITYDEYMAFPGYTWLARSFRTRCHRRLLCTLHPLIRSLCS
jgi:hypothetical protein